MGKMTSKKVGLGLTHISFQNDTGKLVKKYGKNLTLRDGAFWKTVKGETGVRAGKLLLGLREITGRPTKKYGLAYEKIFLFGEKSVTLCGISSPYWAFLGTF